MRLNPIFLIEYTITNKTYEIEFIIVFLLNNHFDRLLVYKIEYLSDLGTTQI